MKAIYRRSIEASSSSRGPHEDDNLEHPPSAFLRVSPRQPQRPITVSSARPKSLEPNGQIRDLVSLHTSTIFPIDDKSGHLTHTSRRRRLASLPCPSKSQFSQTSQLNQFPPPPPTVSQQKKKHTQHRRSTDEHDDKRHQSHIFKLSEDDIPPDLPEIRPRGRPAIREMSKPTPVKIKQKIPSNNKLVERKHVTAPRQGSRSPSVSKISPVYPPVTRSASCMTISELNIAPPLPHSSTLNARRSSLLSRPLPLPPISGYESQRITSPRYGKYYYHSRSPSRSLSRPPSPRLRPSTGLSPRTAFSRSSSSPALISSFTRFSPMIYYSNFLSRGQRTFSPPISPIGNTIQGGMQLESPRSSTVSTSRSLLVAQRPTILPTQPIVAPVQKDSRRKKPS
ncbi:hypothetical protein CVT25_002311 [Psilocybe cyanescens]|uniref:Uncharacterized protein n=1 Tax=Psilocybe cyanescens TaxID=93625 RepID=A0A409WKP4_PSICY|nr:hypothetical protein CVT25_002311 [Psilocybe cyanescens]